jgi:mono/diheme cytochrome c family protein
MFEIHNVAHASPGSAWRNIKAGGGNQEMRIMSDIDELSDAEIDNLIEYHEQEEHEAHLRRSYGMVAHHQQMQKILRDLKKYKQEKGLS